MEEDCFVQLGCERERERHSLSLSPERGFQSFGLFFTLQQRRRSFESYSIQHFLIFLYFLSLSPLSTTYLLTLIRYSGLFSLPQQYRLSLSLFLFLSLTELTDEQVIVTFQLTYAEISFPSCPDKHVASYFNQINPIVKE